MINEFKQKLYADLIQLFNNHPEKLEDVELQGVDTKDYPKFCDAYIHAANYNNGTEVPTEVLEALDSDKIGMLINEMAHDSFC